MVLDRHKSFKLKSSPQAKIFFLRMCCEICDGIILKYISNVVELTTTNYDPSFGQENFLNFF